MSLEKYLKPAYEVVPPAPRDRRRMPGSAPIRLHHLNQAQAARAIGEAVGHAAAKVVRELPSPSTHTVTEVNTAQVFGNQAPAQPITPAATPLFNPLSLQSNMANRRLDMPSPSQQAS